MIRYDDDEVEKIDKESLTGKVQGEYSAGNLDSWCKPSDIHCNGDEDEHGADGGDNCGDGDEDVDGVANKM